jgi:hypothetical protein
LIEGTKLVEAGLFEGLLIEGGFFKGGDKKGKNIFIFLKYQAYLFSL